MNTEMTKDLALWIAELKDCAVKDESFSVSWFLGTKGSPISIIGGWEDGFCADDADLFCLSKSNPTYGMCIKIIVNKGPYAYCDFEVLDMPVFPNGEVDDTCLALEWEDNPEAIADFFAMEYERISSFYEEGKYQE